MLDYIHPTWIKIVRMTVYLYRDWLKCGSLSPHLCLVWIHYGDSVAPFWFHFEAIFFRVDPSWFHGGLFEAILKLRPSPKPFKDEKVLKTIGQ